MHRELKKAPDVPGLLGVTQPTPRYYPNVQIRQGAWIISQRQRRIASIIVTCARRTRDSDALLAGASVLPCGKREQWA